VAVSTLARAALAAAGATLALVAVPAAPASAHASLVRSSPADGSTVTSAPSRVTLTFDDAITRAAVVVTDSTGHRVDRGATRVVGTVAAVGVRLTDAGRYSISYRVVSDDQHPVTHTLSFAFAPSGSVAPAAATTTPADDTGSIGRPVAVIGLALLVFSLLAVALVRALRANRRAAPATIDLRRPERVAGPRERR
jgi:copper transport protein